MVEFPHSKKELGYLKTDYILLVSSVCLFGFVLIGLLAMIFVRKIRNQSHNDHLDLEMRSSDNLDNEEIMLVSRMDLAEKMNYKENESFVECEDINIGLHWTHDRSNDNADNGEHCEEFNEEITSEEGNNQSKSEMYKKKESLNGFGEQNMLTIYEGDDDTHADVNINEESKILLNRRNNVQKAAKGEGDESSPFLHNHVEEGNNKNVIYGECTVVKGWNDEHRESKTSPILNKRSENISKASDNQGNPENPQSTSESNIEPLLSDLYQNNVVKSAGDNVYHEKLPTDSSETMDWPKPPLDLTNLYNIDRWQRIIESEKCCATGREPDTKFSFKESTEPLESGLNEHFSVTDQSRSNSYEREKILDEMTTSKKLTGDTVNSHDDSRIVMETKSIPTLEPTNRNVNGEKGAYSSGIYLHQRGNVQQAVKLFENSSSNSRTLEYKSLSRCAKKPKISNSPK